MSLPAEREFPRNMASLSDLFEFVHEFCASAGAGEDDTYSADLIAEELFTNLVKYNPVGHETIRVALAVENGAMVLSFVDRDVDRFDITAVHLTLEARVPGTDAAKFTELAEKAKAGCPVSKLLKAEITLDAKLV